METTHIVGTPPNYSVDLRDSSASMGAVQPILKSLQ